MNLGEIARNRLPILTLIVAFLALLAVPQVSLAAVAPATESSVTAPVAEAPAPAAADAAAPAAEAADGAGYTPLGPDMIKGQPVNGGYDFQPQYSDIGTEAYRMHTYILMPVITVISLFVLGLLLWVVVRYRRGRNPVPSRTSHNTLIEIIWTFVPVVILVLIAVPSIILLKAQFESPPKDAVTVKVTGYQWYWGYTYPDNGGFEVISNMLPDEEAEARGEPPHLGADNRMVVPVGVPLRIQVIGADVIHAFAVPSLWFKIDAVPGRINERTLTITEPGIYYGQCSELCGARHGYMPIALEAVPMAQFEAFIRSKGGTMPGDEAAAPAAAPVAAPAADEAPARPSDEA